MRGKCRVLSQLRLGIELLELLELLAKAGPYFSGSAGKIFGGLFLKSKGKAKKSKGKALRGVNTLRFQIASQPSTAISTFRTTPPPAVLAPGPLQFQGVAGATVPPRPRLSGYVLGAEMPCSGPGCRHPKYIKHRFQ